MWFVYLLKCSDRKYFIGCTSNLEERIEIKKVMFNEKEVKS